MKAILLRLKTMVRIIYSVSLIFFLLLPLVIGGGEVSRPRENFLIMNYDDTIREINSPLAKTPKTPQFSKSKTLNRATN